MDLSLDESQRILRDSFRDFFRKECPSSRVRAAQTTGMDAALWEAFSDMGAPGMGVPESSGGLGMGLLELCLVASEIGRVLAPLPFAEHAVAARALAASGCPEELVEGIVNGTTIVSLVPALESTAATALVPAGACAEYVLVLRGDELLLVSSGQGGGATRPLPNLASDSLSRWDLAAQKGVLLASGDQARGIYRRALSEWRLLVSAQLVGLTQAALGLGVSYALDREQFGRQIGSYQAIAHPLADCSMRADGAELLVWEAAWAASGQQERFELLCDMAAVFCAETAEETASVSLHTHGGYGFCEEYDIQLFYRRACSWSLMMGGTFAGLKRVTGSLLSLQEEVAQHGV